MLNAIFKNPNGFKLAQAIRNGEEALVNSILSSYFCPYFRDLESFGHTLANACKYPNILRALINAYQHDNDFKFELHNAFSLHCIREKEYNFESLRLLMLSQDLRDRDWSKIFEKVCRDGAHKVIALMLEICEERFDLNKGLLIAAMFKQSQVLEVLLNDIDRDFKLHELNNAIRAIQDDPSEDESYVKLKLYVANLGPYIDSLEEQPDITEILNKLFNFAFAASKRECPNHILNVTELADAIENNPKYANFLVAGFITLWQSNISYHDNALLYHLLINNPEYADKLVQGFVILNIAKLGCNEHASLYHNLALNPKNASSLATGFTILIEAGFSYHDYYELFKFIIDHPEAARTSIAFKKLYQKNITYKTYPMIYHMLLMAPEMACSFADAFIRLLAAKITPLRQPELYQAVLDHTFFAESLSEIYCLLTCSDILYPEHIALYEKVTQLIVSSKTYISTERLAKLISKLIQIGLSFSENSEYFNENNLVLHQNMSMHVLNTLQAAGYSYPEHDVLFHALLTNLNQESPNYQVILKILDEVCRYARESLANNRSLMISELTLIIESQFSPSSLITEGPLNKSDATIKIESLLETITQVASSRWYRAWYTLMHFNQNGHYILTLPKMEPINLSLLIKNANFTQFNLSDDLVNRIGNTLSELRLGHLHSHTVLVSSLPAAEQIAIAYYVRKTYVNINRLFRGEPLDPDALALSPKADLNMLIFFLLGCLLNDAANRLNVSAEQASLQTFLDRGERLDEEAINRRLANPWTLPALTSFSQMTEGSPYFRKPGTTRTKLQNVSRYSIMNPSEGEVLFSHGATMRTIRGPDFLVSTIINSPMFEPPNHYWSDCALEWAFVNHYSQEYKEMISAIVLDGKKVTRPNHNITHVYRVMETTKLVSDYFSDYAKNQDFKKFCESLDDIKHEWLRVAAAFSITGRESEIGAGENLARYDRYRADCANHFLSYVNQTTNNRLDPMKERMAHVVRYMGNPHYESSINNHHDLHERKLRNYYHRILTIAHKLDLPRCYSAHLFKHAMQLCRDLSWSSFEQENAYIELIRYNISLIKAHGGRLSCDILPSGELMDVHTHYKDIYAQSSTSMKRLFELTQLVPKPIRVPQVVSIEENAEASCSSGCSLEDDAQPTAKRTHRSSEINVHRTKRQRI